MNTLKRLFIGITFSAMLATALIGTGSDANAATRASGGSTHANGSGPTIIPAIGGDFQAIGITWE